MCNPASMDSGCDLFAEKETVASLQCCLCVFLFPPSKSFDDNLNLYGVLTSEKASGKHMV